MTNREKFLSKLKLSSEELRYVSAAYAFSKYGHRGQKRDGGERYFEHPKAVAEILINELKLSSNWKLIVTALLHDILEDSFLLDEERIGINFGEDVARWVKILSKEQGIDYYKRLNDCIECGEWIVILVKLADRLHNLRTLPSKCDKTAQKRYITETKKHYIPLAKKLSETVRDFAWLWRCEYLECQLKILV